MTRAAHLVLSYGFLVTACNDQSVGHDFFRGTMGNRIDRMRQYSPEDQYRIFRYGNDIVEPPFIDLAIPIAERGAATIPFLLKELDSDPSDLAVRDTLQIFEKMAIVLKPYDVKADREAMGKLNERISQMKDRAWQGICAEMFQRIRDSR